MAPMIKQASNTRLEIRNRAQANAARQPKAIPSIQDR